MLAILFTSGTSGPPKGCALAHGYFIRNARILSGVQATSQDDVLYTAMPLFHAGAQYNSLMVALYNGIPVVIDAEFSASGVMARLRESKATLLNFVGAMATALLATPPRPNDKDHSVHTMMTAPLPPAAQLAVLDRFGIDAWTELYGQTECVPISASPRMGERDRASIGVAAADLEVALLDDDGEPVPDGDAGEICIRPLEQYSIFMGYWDPYSGVTSAITPESPWHRTGDLARRQPNGRLRFVDRKKDSFRRRGENISSGEVEGAILASPKIVDVAVHAVPAEATEDDLKACVVLADGESITPEEVFAFFKSQLPYFTIPRYVEVMRELPRTPSGRVQKYQLRENPITENTWDLEGLGLRVAKDERRQTGSG